MVRSKMIKGEITGIFTVIPKTKKCIDDEIELYGCSKEELEKMKKQIGLNERYVTDKRTTTADLFECAANGLLKDTNKNRNDIDALICVTETPDYFIPPVATYLQGQ